MKLNNKQKLSIFPAMFIALGIAFLLMTCSCSARKVDKQTTQINENTKIETSKYLKEDVKKESETNIKETKTTTIDEAKNIVTEVTEIIPIDATKKATATDVNGRIIDITNAKYRNEKTTDLSNKKFVEAKDYLEVKKDLETALKIAEERGKAIIELQKQIDIKNSEKKGFNLFSLWWLLLLLLIPIWAYRKEILKKIWWV